MNLFPIFVTESSHYHMIFYFSGTGNSLWVAKQFGEAFQEPLISVAKELKENKKEYIYSLKKDENVFFVFPVHSWGPALLIRRFIARLTLDGYAGHPIYSICTCGDECGYTNLLMYKALFKRNLLLNAGYSVQMPNNYILLNFNLFDVDPKALEEEKLSKAPERITAITEAIRSAQSSDLYATGPMPFVKSRLIYPSFAAFAHRSSFRVMDVCTSCGLCARVCPTGTITMEDGRPEWGNTCVQCTACIHRCPVRAIEYGNFTWKKGRYHHPDL